MKCCVLGCDKDASGFLIPTKPDWRVYPICRECEEKRQLDLMLTGNSKIAINQDNVLSPDPS
jgi:hypothetical protein